MISLALEWWSPGWFLEKTKWWGNYGVAPKSLTPGATGYAFVRLLGLEIKLRWVFH